MPLLERLPAPGPATRHLGVIHTQQDLEGSPAERELWRVVVRAGGRDVVHGRVVLGESKDRG